MWTAKFYIYCLLSNVTWICKSAVGSPIAALQNYVLGEGSCQAPLRCRDDMLPRLCGGEVYLCRVRYVLCAREKLADLYGLYELY
jgi:hypothetical protein